MGSVATSGGVYTWHFNYQERDGKDQRKTQTQTLGVNQALVSVSGQIHLRFKTQNRCKENSKIGVIWLHLGKSFSHFEVIYLHMQMDIFLHFQRNQQKESDAVFNRIADSFVALFMSINPEVKDKFLAVRLFNTFPDQLK